MLVWLFNCIISYCTQNIILVKWKSLPMVTMPYKIKFNKDYFEVQAWQENKLICGIDEVGRGCLAGPVVVAAAILHPHKNNELLQDSKVLDNQQRLNCYSWLKENSWHAVALINHRTIDALNIYQATLAAMKRAFLQLMAMIPKVPSYVLVDAMPLSLQQSAHEDIPVLYFPFAEQQSSSVAAASIIAKVYRDALMNKLDSTVPGYDFSCHKGYSTPSHKVLVKELGESIIHRKTFLTTTLPLNDDYDKQQTLC